MSPELTRSIFREGLLFDIDGKSNGSFGLVILRISMNEPLPLFTCSSAFIEDFSSSSWESVLSVEGLKKCFD